ncbi:hypothetical protein D1007_10358 [Hordeum vulgare]|nr:hypothetical protein D1007_10358 [Hordeum vulgare]
MDSALVPLLLISRAQMNKGLDPWLVRVPPPPPVPSGSQMMPPTASLPAPTSSLQHSRHLRRTGAPASPSSSTGARRRAATPVAGLDCVSMRRCRGLAARDCRWPRLTLVAQDHGARGRPDAPSAAAALVAALHALYPWRPWPPVRTCRRIPRTPAPSMPTAPAPSPQATTAHSATARHSRQRR